MAQPEFVHNMIGTKLAHYEITHHLGSGGMGDVYRARDTKLDRDVAIKVLPEHFAQDSERMVRFEREAKTLASLNHPNIGAIYGVEERALVLELVEGPTLADRIARGPMPLVEALPVAKQIAEALEAAHEQGVIHRDLKPANIKVRDDSTVKVLDFGLAKLIDGNAGREASPASGAMPLSQSPTMMSMGTTQAGMLLGTAAYMSPEQAKGREADKRSDVWAFGAVLYEMFTGKSAFAGEDVSDTLAAVLMREPDWSRLPVDMPSAVCTLLQRCLTKDRRQRVAETATVLFVLRESAALADSSEAAVSPADRAAAHRPFYRRAFPAAITAVLAAAIAGAVMWSLWPVVSTPEVSRFQIPSPPKSQLTQFQVSPDGRFLAFVANDDGVPHLMIRALDTLEPRVLPGTDDASLPFWSPDGEEVAYFTQADNKLRKVSVAGGTPQTLTDAPQRTGGTWNRDGTILFGTARELRRVSSNGGEASSVIKASLEDQDFVQPHFLPDGNHFVYLQRRGPEGTDGIYVAALDGMTPVRLLPDSSMAVFAAPVAAAGEEGHLLWSREGVLVAQPFNTATLQLSGAPYPVAERVPTGGGPQSWSPFTASWNGVLVYADSETSREPVWMNRSGEASTAVTPPGEYSGLMLSPDEKSLVFARGRPSDIWVHDLVRNFPSKLSFDPAADYDPIWAFDSQRVLFGSRRPSGHGLFIKPIAGGTEQLLIKMDAVAGWPTDWSRDGKFVLYVVVDEKNNQDLWFAPQTAGATPMPYLQEPQNQLDGVFSPDGRLVAYTSNESGFNEVYVQPFPKTGQKWLISRGSGNSPKWSRDGRQIYFVTRDRILMEASVQTGTTFVSLAPEPLFEIPNPVSDGYNVGADGRFLVLRPAGSAEPSPVTVVLNWQRARKR